MGRLLLTTGVLEQAPVSSSSHLHLVTRMSPWELRTPRSQQLIPRQAQPLLDRQQWRVPRCGRPPLRTAAALTGTGRLLAAWPAARLLLRRPLLPTPQCQQGLQPQCLLSRCVKAWNPDQSELEKGTVALCCTGAGCGAETQLYLAGTACCIAGRTPSVALIAPSELAAERRLPVTVAGSEQLGSGGHRDLRG